MWPENGSSFHMKSNAASIRSFGTRHAMRAPGARFVAIRVWRIRRIVPAASIARSRSCTRLTSRSASRAISTNGSTRNPAMRSSETARIRAFVGSVISVGTAASSIMWWRIALSKFSRGRMPLPGARSAPVAAMRRLVIDDPPGIDFLVRRAARTPAGRAAGRALAPLFPIGLPGGYLVIAYSTAHWVRRRGGRGARSIVASAWLGWALHRAVKIVLRRRRPQRPGARVRYDSFPSGHTTGATALALTTAIVLRRQRLVSPRSAAVIGVGAPLLMGFYRVVADDHWATDVAGGWALGTAIALLSLTDPPKMRRGPRRVRRAAPRFEESRGR